MFGSVAVKSYVSLGFFIILCKAQNQNLLYNRLETNIKEVKEHLRCYVCNSKYDPHCADPFSSYTVGIVNCSEQRAPEILIDLANPTKSVEPVLCRKIVQKVEGEVRVIRGCGYVRDDHDDKKCYRRTGTSAVEVIHCSCTKSLCNTGQALTHSSLIVILVALTVLAGIQNKLPS